MSFESKPYVEAHCHIFTTRDVPLEGFVSRHAPESIPPRLIDFALWLIRKITQEDSLDEFPFSAFQAANESQTIEVVVEEAVLKRYQRETDIDLGGGWDPKSDASPLGIVRWIFLLTRERALVARRMLDSSKKVQLFLPAMFDLDHWVPGVSVASTAEQIKALEKLVRNQSYLRRRSSAPSVELNPLASFNPLKAIVPGRPYVDMIKDALLNRGFVGAKIYPPAGFRVVCNDSEEIRKLVSPEYREIEQIGPAIDEVLAEFFSFCVEHEVPIMTHSTPFGAQGDPGSHTGWQADPLYWHLLMASRPQFRDLQVNFAHFGGVGEDDPRPDIPSGCANIPLGDFPLDKPWTERIVWMMEQYPNVYADIGYHVGYSEPSYSERVGALLRSHPILKCRLMYGSDWHLTVTGKTSRVYWREMRQVFSKLLSTEQELADFMGGNALKYLGIAFDSQARQRLLRYYDEVLRRRAPSYLRG